MPSFTHSLNIIGRCTQMQRGAVLKELGVCGGQVPYLLRLCRCPGLTQEELAKALYFNKSTVTRQIAALERQGLVRREPSPEDRRCQLVPHGGPSGKYQYCRGGHAAPLSAGPALQ